MGLGLSHGLVERLLLLTYRGCSASSGALGQQVLSLWARRGKATIFLAPGGEGGGAGPGAEQANFNIRLWVEQQEALRWAGQGRGRALKYSPSFSWMSTSLVMKSFSWATALAHCGLQRFHPSLLSPEAGVSMLPTFWTA